MTMCLEGYLDASELPSIVQTQNARRQRLSYNWEERGERIHTKGFPNHTKECIRVLADYIGQRSVLEVGAGTGFLARHLHECGVNIRAIDSQKGDCTQPVWWEGNKLFFPVEAIDALSFDAYVEDIVLMAWPCYESSFAAEVVERLRVGQVLIYLEGLHEELERQDGSIPMSARMAQFLRQFLYEFKFKN